MPASFWRLPTGHRWPSDGRFHPGVQTVFTTGDPGLEPTKESELPERQIVDSGPP